MYQWVKISSVLLFAALTACSGSFTSEKQLYVESKQSFEVTNDCSPDESSCTYLSATYPIISGPGSESINLEIKNLTLSACSFGDDNPTSLDLIGDAFITEFKQFQQDYPESPIAWEITSEITWEQATDTLYNLSQYFTSYTGGAHGNSYQLYQVYSNSGIRLQLGDLFISSFEGKLSSQLDNQFRKMRGLSAKQSLTSHGNLFVERIEPTNNFYFTENSIHFIYNAYDIAPYVEGTIDIEIPLQEVKHLLRSNSNTKQAEKHISSLN